MKTHSQSFPVKHLLAQCISLLLASTVMAQTTVPSGLNLEQKPLFLGGTDPNVMFILDNSGSMYWSFMPDSLGKYALTTPSNNGSNCKTTGFAKWMTSSSFNSMYYDPAATYLPPMEANGTSKPNASFTAAKWNGYIPTLKPDNTYVNATTLDLSTQYRSTWGDGAASTTSGVQCLYLDNANTPAYYNTFNAANTSCPTGTTTTTPITTTAPNDNCFTNVPVTATSGPSRARAELNGTTSQDERTNFANWYTYYRTRMYTAKAGISRAFAQSGTNMYVGYGALNESASSNLTQDGVTTNTIKRGVRPFKDYVTGSTDAFPSGTTYRTDFFNWLFAKDPANGTPLREALDYAGKYYETSTAAYAAKPWSPEADKQVSCRQSFTILMTDGYWNGNAAITNAKNDNDGNPGAKISPASGTGLADYTYAAAAPFKDGAPSQSNTLADVAMYYWNRDLRIALSNNVPVSSTSPDNAFWQHMTTFTIGMGLAGTTDKVRAFKSIKAKTGDADFGYPSSWPIPAANSENNLDDLLHAGVNGHGGFYSAKNPMEFASALSSTLAEVGARAGSAATLAVNSGQLDTGSVVYQASFNSGAWSGDVKAYTVNPDTGALTLLAQASDGVPTAWASRNIFTWRPAHSNNGTAVTAAGVSFTSENLSPTQTTAISTGITNAQFDTAPSVADIVDYIRGDKSKEASAGGPLRTRTGAIGDIVNSDPVYVGKFNFGYAYAGALGATERGAYNTFVASQTTPSLYVGANDGMLHALNGSKIAASALDELFTYVPNNVIGNLPLLAKATNFNHTYFVDGPITVGHAYLNNAWKTILVGSTGAGGRSYFALDITTPSSPTVLWEFSHAKLGKTMGRASITYLNNNTWGVVFGNGYNSDSGTAGLFVLDLATGAMLTGTNPIEVNSRSTTRTNGLSGATMADADGDGSTDVVFAGDLQGNMWKFNLASSTASNWGVAFGGKPLFQTQNTGTAAAPIFQPITSKPSVVRHPQGGLMALFGTGQFIATGDQSVLDMQSYYAVRDECGARTGDGCSNSTGVTNAAKVALGDLVQQTFTETTSTTTNATTTTSYTNTIRTLSKNTISAGKKGWYINLRKDTTNTGERVVSNSTLLSDRVIFASIIPNTDVCGYGGDSWIWQVDLFTGGETPYSVFDLNRDKTFGADDAAGAVKRDGLIKGGGGVMGTDSNLGLMQYSKSDGGTGNDWVNLKSPTGRQSWRQIR